MPTKLKLPNPSDGRMIAELDEGELAVRLLEAASGTKRPAGATPAQALAIMEGDLQSAVLAMARAALDYFGECIAALQKVN
jgi:hypothetical protein